MSAQVADDPTERLRELRAEAENREVDELLDGRREVAHFYTGVAKGIEAALEALAEEGDP